jgi:ArsR family transcriptional regulator
MFISVSDVAGRKAAGGALVVALRAAGETTRLRALALLARGELAVGEIAEALGQSQPRISRHLRLLTDSKLVERAPEGAWVFYRLAPEGTVERAFVDSVLALLGPGDPEFDRDTDRLRTIFATRAAEADAYFAENAEDWARLRALNLPEGDVETAVLQAAGPGPFELMIDVGVGQGRIIEIFLDRVRRAEGIDTSRQMLKVARGQLAREAAGKASVRWGDIYEPPFPPASADLVTIHQVLHYLTDPARAIFEAVRLLKPGGRIVIADFAPHTLEFLRENHAHRRLGFSDAEIATWCAAAGVPQLATQTLDGCEGETLTVKVWAGDRILGGEE